MIKSKTNNIGILEIARLHWCTGSVPGSASTWVRSHLVQGWRRAFVIPLTHPQCFDLHLNYSLFSFSRANFPIRVEFPCCFSILLGHTSYTLPLSLLAVSLSLFRKHKLRDILNLTNNERKTNLLFPLPTNHLIFSESILYCLHPYFLWLLTMKINLLLWEKHMLSLGMCFHHILHSM